MADSLFFNLEFRLKRTAFVLILGFSELFVFNFKEGTGQTDGRTDGSDAHWDLL